VTANPWPVSIYGLLVAAFLLLPWLAQSFRTRSGSEPGERWIGLLLVAGACLLAFLRGWELIEASILLALSAAGRGLVPLAGAAAAALLFAPVTWWLRESGISQAQFLLFIGLCLGLAVLSRRAQFAVQDAGRPTLTMRTELILVGAMLVLGLGAGLLTGAANEHESVLRAWHHWGAYISPVSALLAGGVPFRDFPVQYGMGPTLLIAATCPMGCWTGLYGLTVAANALELAAFGWSLLLLTRRLDTPSRMLALAAQACAMLVWTGYPLDWGGAIMTPSVAGMRFLPLVLLLTLIITAEHGPRSPALPRRLAVSGHLLWFLGLAWSPENAFFASLLWWPYLALRRADMGARGRDAWLNLIRGGLTGLAAVVAGYAGLALLFRLIFGDWVRLSDFLLYLRNPPGAMPVNALGPIWFVAAILLLAARALSSAQPASGRRVLYACLLATLAALSYYLSRSHDNNLLNLLPFLLLVLIAAQALFPSQFVTGFVRAALVAVVAFSATISFHPWTIFPGSSGVAGLQVGPAALTMRFTPSLKLPQPLLAPDAAGAFDDLHARGIDAILLFDDRMLLPLGEPAASWTAVNNLANFIPLPDADIARYIRRSAAVYHRPGWIVLKRKDYGHWLALFQTAYGVTEERRYGSYSDYYLVPRDPL